MHGLNISLCSKEGKKVKKNKEDENNVILTPECCLAEIKGWLSGKILILKNYIPL